MPDVNPVNNNQPVQNNTRNPAAEETKPTGTGRYAQDLNQPVGGQPKQDANVDLAGLEQQNAALEAQKAAGTGMAAVGAAIPGVGGAMSSIGLLQMQQAIQQQSMMFTTTSNVMKSKHDASMSVVRNIKGG